MAFSQFNDVEKIKTVQIQFGKNDYLMPRLWEITDTHETQEIG